MAARDFWGDIQENEVRTPLSILREQAALLGPKTKHLLKAEVGTYVSSERFVHHFNLVVPALDNYRYELFGITHGIDLYPVVEVGRPQEMHNEDEFIAWLQQRLTSQQTRRIINTLMSQARS
jgi:hypothetical protein